MPTKSSRQSIPDGRSKITAEEYLKNHKKSKRHLNTNVSLISITHKNRKGENEIHSIQVIPSPEPALYPTMDPNIPYLKPLNEGKGLNLQELVKSSLREQDRSFHSHRIAG